MVESAHPEKTRHGLSILASPNRLHSERGFRPGKGDTEPQQEGAVKYLGLGNGEESKFEGVRDEECVAYVEAQQKSSRCLAAEALRTVQTATTLRVRDGKLSLTDGPFAETKEQLAGF